MFTAQHLYFDDLEIGQTFTSSGRTVTETDIVNFAGVSGDFNSIHVDHAFAATTSFRRPIAHGLLVMAIGSGLGTLSPPQRIVTFLGICEWKFLLPVFPGDTVRLICRVLEREERSRGRRGMIRWHREILNQEDRIVQTGITEVLLEGRGGSSKSGSGQDAESTAS